MKVLLTGATGWIGSTIARNLIADGHQVTGLVRSADKAGQVEGAGMTALVGELSDLDTLREAAEQAEGIIHTAFGLDLSKIVELAEEERRALETFGDVFAGSDRPIVVTSGVLLLPDGEVLTEQARPPVVDYFPRSSEQTAFRLAERGVKAMVVRNPRSVHGQGEKHGWMPMLAQFARDKGVSAYVGEGANLWPAVHREDSARAFCLALERGEGGQAYHGIAEEGLPFRAIAEAIGRQVGVPTRSLTQREAEAHYGPLTMFVAGNGAASNAWTREKLGWQPREIGLVADVERPDYSA